MFNMEIRSGIDYRVASFLQGTQGIITESLKSISTCLK